jgi:hypothetical protein
VARDGGPGVMKPGQDFFPEPLPLQQADQGDGSAQITNVGALERPSRPSLER